MMSTMGWMDDFGFGGGGVYCGYRHILQPEKSDYIFFLCDKTCIRLFLEKSNGGRWISKQIFQQHLA